MPKFPCQTSSKVRNNQLIKNRNRLDTNLLNVRQRQTLIPIKVKEGIREKYNFENIKTSNRNNNTDLPTTNYLLLVEHPHVYTLGKSGDETNLLINEKALQEKDATYYKINRGGDITYHGPGQLVGYPILDLDNFFTDIHKYLRFL